MSNETQKKVTVILGGQGTGKTVKALKMIGEKKFETSLGDVDKTTEVLLLEDFSKGLSGVFKLLKADELLYRRPFAPVGELIPRPTIIITSNDGDLADLELFTKEFPHLEIINL